MGNVAGAFQRLRLDAPPQLAFNWIDNPQLSAFTLVDGHAPQAGEFTMDIDAAAKYGFVIGDTYELVDSGEIVAFATDAPATAADPTKGFISRPVVRTVASVSVASGPCVIKDLLERVPR